VGGAPKKTQEKDFLIILIVVLFILERFLYRLSLSVHRARLVLKGGMLPAAFDERRPTRDA